MSQRPPNLLYYGDNLDILRRYVEDESVDLVYAQIKAFEDIWEWRLEATQEEAEVLRSGNAAEEVVRPLSALAMRSAR